VSIFLTLSRSCVFFILPAMILQAGTQFYFNNCTRHTCKGPEVKFNYLVKQEKESEHIHCLATEEMGMSGSLCLLF
jgi:hypothetical protein